MLRAREGHVFERDVDYFQRRAAEERSAADRATSEGARNAHLDLAQRYDELAQGIDAQQGQSVDLHLGSV